MDIVNLTINKMPVAVPRDTTVLEAARHVGIEIPSLCYLKDINKIGSCRICVVEVEGARNLVASCVTPVTEGMVVNTNTDRVRHSRKRTLELIMSSHNTHCLTCPRNLMCELQKLADAFEVERIPHYDGMFADPEQIVDRSAPHLVRDNSKCLVCRRCVAACVKNQSVAAIGINDRGFETHISSAFDRNLDETSCVHCGQCVVACPIGALTDKNSTGAVWRALTDPKKHVVVATAPAVRVTLGECFNMPIGTNVEGKMVAALRRLGFDSVFDIDTAADLTIMEEGAELLDRIKNDGVLPLITSCSPGWIRFCEMHYPEFIPNLSTCKSPQQMFGAIMKSYYAKSKDLDPKDIFVVSVMPCTAKKSEIKRDSLANNGPQDVDAVITTRGLAHMILRAGIMFADLSDESFDPAFGISTGAGVIFGASGGVLEAAMRTIYETLSGSELTDFTLEYVHGLDGVKEAKLDIAGKTVRVASCSGLSNARRLLDGIRAGELQYDFIEIMCCPGGCINGGGQPVQHSALRNFSNLLEMRTQALRAQDKAMPLRKSHENPVIKKIYEDHLGEPGGRKAHKLLHTSFRAGKKYPIT